MSKQRKLNSETRLLAAILLKVPMSGVPELDVMISKSRQDDYSFADAIITSIIAHQKNVVFRIKKKRGKKL